MSVIPVEHLITCNRCDVSGSVAGPIFERIKHQIPEADLARLEQGLKTDQYEVSLVLAPGFEYLPENYGIERSYHRKRGTYQPVYEFNEFTGQLSSMILRADGNEPPRAPDTFWALQVLDRSEHKEDQKRGHYAVLFCGQLEDQARWVDLTFTDAGRLLMSISDIGEVGSYLFEWVDRFGLFKTIDYPPLRRRKGSRKTGNGTTTVLFHRFLEAAIGTYIDPVIQLEVEDKKTTEGKETKEDREVHHVDGRPLHNCWSNRKCLRRSVHEALSAVEGGDKSSRKAKRSNASPGGTLGGDIHPIQGRGLSQVNDPFLDACTVNFAMDSIALSVKKNKNPCESIPDSVMHVVEKSALLSSAYKDKLDKNKQKRSHQR